MLPGDNLALLVSRQTISPFRHVFASRSVATFNVLDNAGRHGAGPFFPLYTFLEVKGRKASKGLGLGALKEHNLSAEVVNELAMSLALTFVATGYGDLRKTFGPEDIFGYVYALLHASTFRADFGAQLRTGFPRVPLAPGGESFRELSRLGSTLVDLHTGQTNPSMTASFPKSGNNIVGKPEFISLESNPNLGRVMINEDQYFQDVPLSVWSYQIGRYQVCLQWLKERIGRKLSYDEIVNYSKIIGALSDGLALNTRIDEELLLRPLWKSS